MDENLPNFFEAVKLQERDWILKENKYYAENHKMPLLREKTSASLEKVNMTSNPIQGLHWYSPLCNMSYVQDFAYISCSVPDRADYIVDGDDEEGNDNEQSDFVAIALNFAFMDDKLAAVYAFAKDNDTGMK